MRVYRDIRFSRDKTPYKTNIGIQFRHEAGKDVHAPGFYLHIEPDNTFLGVGMWHPDSEPLRQIRERIAERPDEWKKVARGRAFTRRFELQGESLKRPPRGFAGDHPFVDDLKRKDFIAVTSLGNEDIAAPELPGNLLALFGKSSGYMAFLCNAVGVPF